MESDERKKQRWREREDEAEQERLKKKDPDKYLEANPDEKFIKFFEQVEPLLEQLNNLYRNYVNGVESRPPIERRKRLDEMMSVLQLLPKSTAKMRFDFQMLFARYQTQKVLWDKMLRRLEVGKK